MSNCSSAFGTRRSTNAAAISVFGGRVSAGQSSSVYRTVRQGKRSAPTVYTIGYEQRDGDDLISALLDAGVDVLVDVRERPFSRKPDFRLSALRARCEDAGIRYESRTRLGSTAAQREIHASGEIGLFMSRFRDFATRRRSEEVAELAKLARKESIAMICYERDHDDCHRCILADLLADSIGATVVAIQ